MKKKVDFNWVVGIHERTDKQSLLQTGKGGGGRKDKPVNGRTPQARCHVYITLKVSRSVLGE